MGIPDPVRLWNPGNFIAQNEHLCLQHFQKSCRIPDGMQNVTKITQLYYRCTKWPHWKGWGKVLETALYLCGLPPRNPQLQSSPEQKQNQTKPSREKSHPRVILQNTRSIIHKTVRFVKKKKKEDNLGNCHSQDQPRKTWWWPLLFKFFLIF